MMRPYLKQSPINVISNEKKFIFVHIPKTAGSSITYVLRNYSLFPVSFLSNGNAKLDGKHLTAKELIDHAGGHWNEYYSFAVVRNPWDRVISTFSYLQSVRHPLLKGAKTPGEWIIAGNVWCYPCADYVTVDGKIVVNQILRYETLQQDFNLLCEKLAIAPVELPRSNASRHEHYSSYYDYASKEIVANLFKDDIRLFGYSFDVP